MHVVASAKKKMKIAPAFYVRTHWGERGTNATRGFVAPTVCPDARQFFGLREFSTRGFSLLRTSETKNCHQRDADGIAGTPVSCIAGPLQLAALITHSLN